MQKVTGHSILFWLLASGSSAHASQQQGVDWLKQALNNSSVNNPSIASDVQVKNELAYTLSLLDSYPSNIDVSVGDDQSTEALSRALLLAAKSGADSQALLQSILVRQNSDGGFGHLDGWQSTVLDTAIVLLLADNLPKETTLKAIQFLLQQQAADGGYYAAGYQPVERLYINAYVLLAVNKLIASYPELTEILRKHIAFLEGQQISAGQWSADNQDLFIDALLNQALHAYRQNMDIATAFSQKAFDLQLNNGSWQDDAYVTSVVLRSLVEQQKPRTSVDITPISSSITIKSVDTETGLGLPNVLVTVKDANNVIVSNTETDTNGTFILAELNAGSYHFELSKTEYNSVSFDVQISQGQKLDVGVISLSRATNSNIIKIQGKITDVNGQAIAGALLSIKGTSLSVTSTADGSYQLPLESEGSFLLEVNKQGFVPITVDVTLKKGVIYNYSPELTLEIANISAVTGVIKNNTGLVLSDVEIVDNGVVIGVTNNQGYFNIQNIKTGERQFVFRKSGYQQTQLSVALLAGKTTTLDLVIPLDNVVTNTAIQRFSIINANDKTPIKNVFITAELLDSFGIFKLNQTFQIDTEDTLPLSMTLPVGKWRFTISHPSYISQTIIINIEPTTNQTMSVQLSPNTFKIKGKVVDSISNKPIANVKVNLFSSKDHRLLTNGVTNQSGDFQSAYGVSETKIDMEIEHSAYMSTTRFINKDYYPQLTVDISEIRLRPLSANIALSDLAVIELNRDNVTTDAQSLQTTGTLQATIVNKGNAKQTSLQNVNIVAFYDNNKNKVLDENEPFIGHFSMPLELDINQSLSMDIPINGKALFKDAPISVWVDSQNQIVDSKKNNNIRSTADDIEIKSPVGTLDYKEAWQVPFSSDAMPIAAPLRDTNGDGRIGQGDIASVIVYSYPHQIVINGKTGAVEFKIPIFSRYGTEVAAIANVDLLDAEPEIVIKDGVAVNVYSNTGVLKKTFAVASPYSGWATNPNHPHIADLDQDGFPEIIADKYIISYRDNLVKASSFPQEIYAVANINNDNYLELIGSQGVATKEGDKICQYKQPLNFLSIADVLNTGKPQIVGVNNSRIYIIDPLTCQNLAEYALSSGGGGVPVIADFDGDGLVDIGTAQSTSYSAIRYDGSVIWSKPTQDSSAGTGSTVFDIDNDGKFEILHGDEGYLRIFDSATGAERLKLVNRTPTAHEQPIVVDADADGHADIIIVSSYGNKVRMLSGKNDDWANTRNIWNQYSYHVTNINDDLTVPQHEPNSWEVHNTYRANLLLNESSTAAADSTSSYIRIQDNGLTQPSVFTVRIGNAGGKTINTGLPISFYQGNPAQGGVLLGTTLTSRALASGEYEDVTFNYTGSLANFGELYIVANDKGSSTATIIQEYTAANNIAHLPVEAGYQKLNLQSSLDKNSYQSTESLSINSVINNAGSFDSLADLRLSLIDSAGQTLGSLPFVPLSLTVQTTVNNASLWSASGLRKGDYTVKAELYRNNQRVVQQLLPFSVLSDAAPTGLLAPSLTSNKKSYSSADTVTLTQQVRNSSTNEVANNVQTTLVLQKADGTVVWQQSRDYGQIAPQVLREQSFQAPLLNAAAGDYTARLTVTADNVPTVTSEAHFNVLPTAMTGVGLSGQLQGATDAVWYQDLNYTWQISNQGNSDVQGLPVRLAVINPQTEQLIATVLANTDVAQNGQTQQQSQFSVFGMTAPLLVLLQVQIGDDWKTLAQQPLTVSKPVVTTQITADKTQYGLNDPIVINEVIHNQSVVNLQQVKVTTLISQPNGQIVSESNQILDINAQSQLPQTVNYTLNRATAGQWQITTIIQDKNAIELNRQVSTFEVLSSTLTGEGLTGRLALPAQAVRGQSITMDWGLDNAGNSAYTDLPTRIELIDDQQQVIATLTNPVASLAVDTPFNQQSVWTVVGNYNQSLQARLLAQVANQWKVLANAPLQVLAPQVSEILTTSKTSYGINELLDIKQQIKNDSPVLLNNVKVTTLISRPDGLVVDTQQTTLNLAAQSGVEQPVSYQFNQADAGQWTITSIVQDEQGIELTRQVKTIEVQSTAITGEGISGTLTATPVEVIVGQDVTLALALNNQGNAALNQQVISLTINKVGSTTPVKVITITVDSLAKANTVTTNANWTVTGQAGDVFSVVATTRFNGQVNTLASASFMAKAPEIAVELTPELAAQSRVLVYYSCGHDWYKGIKGWSFGDCHYSCFDQRSATLRAYLDSLKVNFSLVTKESDFVKAFRSGRYNQTWLLGAIEKLPKDMDEELHEAVYRGDALVTDGGMQTWYNHDIYDIVGVKYRGRLNFSNSEMTLTAPVFSQTQAIGKVKSAGWPLYLKATTGTVTATYGANYCKSVDKDWIRDKEDEDKEFYGRHQISYPAMISNQYGYGKGLSMAFDLIASLDQPTEKTKWLSLLDQSLSWTNPTVNHRVDYVPKELVAVRSQLKSAGTQAQTIRLQVILPVGAVWMGTGTVDANRTVTQTITLAANSQQQVWLPILLPSLSGTHQLTIKTLSANGQQILSEKQLPFTVKGIDNRFAEVRIAFEQLALNKQDDKLRDKVVDEIRDAQYLWSKGRYQEALAELGDASAYIRNIEGRDVSKERLALDILMKGLSIQWFNAQR